MPGAQFTILPLLSVTPDTDSGKDRQGLPDPGVSF